MNRPMLNTVRKLNIDRLKAVAAQRAAHDEGLGLAEQRSWHHGDPANVEMRCRNCGTTWDYEPGGPRECRNCRNANNWDGES